MAYEQDRLALLLEFLKLVITFRLEEHVADGQRLIHDQDLRLDIDGQRKSQTDEHTGRISFHRLMHKVPDIGKRQDIIQLRINLLFGKTDHGAIQINILQSGIFRIETCPQFQESRDPSVYVHFAGSRVQNTGNDL